MVADITITGNKKTKLYIIQREIPFKVGQYFLPNEMQSKLELCRNQLMNTALFVDVIVTIEKQEAEKSYINIVVKERFYLFPIPYFKLADRNFNQWWVEQKRDFGRVNYGIKLTKYNFSGRNDRMNLTLIGGYSTQILFRYDKPFADKTLKHGWGVGYTYIKNKEINYGSVNNKQRFIRDEPRIVREVTSVDAGYSYRPDSKSRHFLRFSYTDESLADTVIKLNPDYFGSHNTRMRFFEISYNYKYLGVDYIPYPWKGLSVEGTLHYRGFKKDFNELQLNLRASYHIPLPIKSNLQLQAATSISFPSNQPFYNNRLFGYNDFILRGMEYYVIDGTIGFLGRVSLRKEILNFNFKTGLKSKAYNKIPFRFVLKTYGDMGYAYEQNPNPTSTLNNKLLRTWGLGLDIVTFYDVVIKLEYSFNQLGDKGLFLHGSSDF